MSLLEQGRKSRLKASLHAPEAGESGRWSTTIDNEIITLRSPSISSTVTREKPDDLASVLFDVSAELKKLTSRVSMHLPPQWREVIFNQIDSLCDPEEWDEEDAFPSIPSFRTFLRLLLTLKPSKRPGLGMSGAGVLVAAWTNGRNRLTVECQPQDQVRWVLAREMEGRVERCAGQTTIERLSDCLAPYHPIIWFSDAQYVS